MSDTHITVRGAHTVERVPDIGTVTVTIRVESGNVDDSREVFGQISDEHAEEYERLLAASAITAVDRDEELAWREWNDGGPLFVRTQRHRLTFIDFAAMNAFLHLNAASPQIVELTATTRLAADTAGLLLSQARRLAAEDAAARARDFAAEPGVQLTLLALRELPDDGSIACAAWAGQDVPMLRVHAAVEATFAVRPAAPPTSPA